MDVLDGRVVINFVHAALENSPLTIYGDGKQTRSLCYVSDMVEGIAQAMECDFHEPINLGNLEEVAVIDIAKEVKSLVPGCTSELVFAPMPPDDPRHRCPDITRAKQLFRWSPKVSRREGLAKIIENYRAEMAQGQIRSEVAMAQ